MNAREIAAYHAGVQAARDELAAPTRVTSSRREDPSPLDLYRDACDALRAACTNVVRARALIQAREVTLAEDVLAGATAGDAAAVRRRKRRDRLADAERDYRRAVEVERAAVLTVRRTRAVLLGRHPQLRAYLTVSS